MNPLLEVLCNEINKIKKMLTTTGTDYTATVTRVDGNTAYVQMSGSEIADTPVSMTINAHIGDKVRVRVSNGKAWITGNDTAPPSDNKQVLELIENNSQGLIETEVKYSRIAQSIDNIKLEVGEKMDSDMGNRASSISIDSGKIEFNSNTLVVNSDNFTLDDDGDATFGGTLNAAGGSFTGELRFIGDYVAYGDQTVIISPTGSAPIYVGAEPVSGVTEVMALGATEFKMTYDDDRLSTERHDKVTISALSAQFSSWPESNIYTYIDKNAIRVRRNSSWTDYGYDGAHSTSDIRLKEDITRIKPEIAKHLIPVQFRFKGDDKTHYGFIAQDVQKVIPDVVDERTDGYLSLTYNELIAPLYALVQEQEDRISRLEARIELLEKGE